MMSTRGYNIGGARDMLMKGRKPTRLAWAEQGRGMWLELQYPSSQSKVTSPYVVACRSNGQVEPYVPTQEDLLAEDWVEQP